MAIRQGSGRVVDLSWIAPSTVPTYSSKAALIRVGQSEQTHLRISPLDDEENGLFWTIPLSKVDLKVDVDDGSASLSLTNLDIDDYGNVANALSGGAEIATASLTVRIRWSGLTHAVTYSNGGLPTPFAARELQAVNSGATMHWTAVENGYMITGHINTADFAVLARDRNGVFFSSDDGD